MSDPTKPPEEEQKLADWLRQQQEIVVDPGIGKAFGDKLRKRRKEQEAQAWQSPEIGALLPDGSVFAGLTPDGSHRIFAMPADFEVTVTFADAADRIAKLNAGKVLGHDDWQLPTREQLNVLWQNQEKGALRGTFTHEPPRGASLPLWYWSSTPNAGDASEIASVRFSDGAEGWCHRYQHYLSCRPVRLLATAPSPG